MTQDEIIERIRYWKKIPRALWDKDEIIDISFEMNRIIGREIDDTDQFIADLIEKHNIVLDEAERLFVENTRMKHTIKTLTSRSN